jgi:hypothetical protein
MLKNRPPYDAKVDAEVAKEYQCLQDEKRRVRPDHDREIEAVRTRVSDLEGSVQHLGENVAASHKRLEDMMRKILQKHGNAGEDTTKASSSAKMLDTSALTSTMVEATTLVHESIPTPLLTTMGVVDARLPTEVHVSNDVAEDAATDANTDKQGVHSSPATDIAAVVEDILEEEGRKSTNSHAIVDLVMKDNLR